MIAGEGGAKRMWEMVLSGEKEEKGGKKREWKGGKEGSLRRLNVRVRVPLRIKEGAQEFSGAPMPAEICSNKVPFLERGIYCLILLFFFFFFFFCFLISMVVMKVAASDKEISMDRDTPIRGGSLKGKKNKVKGQTTCEQGPTPKVFWERFEHKKWPATMKNIQKRDERSPPWTVL